MSPTPGLRFILTTVPTLLAPPFIVHAVLSVLAHRLNLSLHPALVAAVCSLTLPLFLYIRACYTHFSHARQANRLGAELVPEFRGKLPFNIDLLWSNFFAPDLYLGDGFARAIDSHGTTFANNVLGDLRIVTAHPQNIRRILATDVAHYEKGPKFSAIAGSVLGVGVFNSDGDMWQFHRKLTRPFFARERVTDFGIFDANTAIAVQKMQERFDAGGAIDFQDICSRFTIDSACEFLLGASIHSLLDPLPTAGEIESTAVCTPSNRFATAFAAAQVSVSTRGRIGVAWPLFEVLKDRTGDDMRVVRGFIEDIVREAVSKRERGDKHKEAEDDSLLQHLLNVTQDMKLIVDETINIMLAGRDTTAGLLTFVAYCLAQHPAVLATLRREILHTVGPNRAPTFEDVRGMKYLRAVINETLRLFPSVPFNSRHTTAPTTLLADNGAKLFVPAHTRVAFSSMLAQRHAPFWGPDAHLFDPERWIDERRERVVQDPFLFVPFSAGPRICLGQQFAYHEASFFLIRLLQRFDGITLAPGCQAPASRPPASWRTRGVGEYVPGAGMGTPRKALEECVLQSHLTMYVEGGLWLRMERSREAGTPVMAGFAGV